MPTSTSLVTNLPADFNTFGQAVDTSMAQLKGGTTGQVLSKTSATDMAFTWVTPTDQTPLTTKGDLFTFTTVDARLAVGNNGETLVADSSTSTGLRWQSPYSQQSVLNSAFQVWQRGTSGFAGGANAAGGYCADRWQVTRGGYAAGLTASRQATSDTTNLPFIQYCIRVQRDSGNTSTATLALSQSFESANSIPLAGKTVTLSFYGRAGANYSATSNALTFRIDTGTGTDQNLINGYTGGASSLSSTATLTTTWQRFTATATLPTGTTELGIYFAETPTGTAGANDYYEITGVQLEVGSVATPFKTYAATIQGELAACQRYFVRWGGGSIYEAMANAQANSTTGVSAYPVMPVQMRVPPTSVAINALAFYDTVTVFPLTGPVINTNINGTKMVQIGFTGSSLTQFRYGTIIANNSSSGYLELSAEL